MKRGAGTLLLCPKTNKILMAFRRDDKKWSNFGGMVEKQESPFQCAKRELLEESGFLEYKDYYMPSDRAINVGKYKNFEYKCYVAIMNKEKYPNLNFEHDKFMWMTVDEIQDLGNELHFGIKKLFSNKKVLRRLEMYLQG